MDVGTQCFQTNGNKNLADIDPTDLASMSLLLGAVVSAAFRLNPNDLGSASRGNAEVAFARQVAMYLVHTRLGCSYLVAGRLFGRDRTTARHACRRVEDRREDPRIDLIIDYLERAIDIWPRIAGLAAGRGHG